jgi:hypothetical protein
MVRALYIGIISMHKLPPDERCWYAFNISKVIDYMMCMGETVLFGKLEKVIFYEEYVCVIFRKYQQETEEKCKDYLMNELRWCKIFQTYMQQVINTFVTCKDIVGQGFEVYHSMGTEFDIDEIIAKIKWGNNPVSI